jgi:membrane protein implicated in regulation of membrane protease activity
MIIEMYLGGTIGFFFAGIAAFCVALCMKFNLITLNTLIDQIGFFFGFFCLWSIVLWKPTKYLLNIGNTEVYHNIEGGIATVYGHDLKGENLGEIRWSGAICKAKLSPSSKNTILKKGDNVTIVSVKNNIFIVEK